MKIENLDKIKLPDDFDNKIENVYKKGRKKHSKTYYLRNIAAAITIVFLAGFTVPGYTRDLPLYSKVFTLLGMQKYQDSSELMLITKEDEGIKITLSDAVFSNNVLSYTYIIESSRDLGEDIGIHCDIDMISHIKYNIVGTAGISRIEKVGKNTYLGGDEIWLDFGDKEAPQGLNLKLNISKIMVLDYNYGNTDVEIKGKWDFPISIKRLDDNVTIPTFIYEEKGVFAKIAYINTDSAVSSFEINIWNNLDIVSHAYTISSSSLKDEEGNNYTVESFGGFSNEKISKALFQSEILEKGKKYTFEMDIIKDAVIGYDEEGILTMIDDYWKEEFKNAPERIKVVIPFEL